MKLTATSYQRGLWAEIYTIAFLVLKGYRILAWRYKTPVGEVDIIAKRGNIVHFIEVKLRPTLDDGVLAVSPQGRSRITRAATHFMANKKWVKRLENSAVQFDIIAVCGFRIRHLDNAWQSGA